jgi:hypothetical protein
MWLKSAHNYKPIGEASETLIMSRLVSSITTFSEIPRLQPQNLKNKLIVWGCTDMWLKSVATYAQ